VSSTIPLSTVLLTRGSMFFQLLYIHLYRPFLKYTRQTSPLPAHVSPRKYCTQAAGAISKLFRLYKRTYGLRQICNIAIYIMHSACTIHFLNLPDKNARRDIIHGVKHLEEMGECWTAARRTLRILHVCTDKWKIEPPEEAEVVFLRAKAKWGLGEAAPSPVSPQTLANMVTQVSAQPVPDLMAQNVQQQQGPPQQSTPEHRTLMSQVQAGLWTGLAPSPSETVDTRRSSGSMSLPPRSAADLGRNVHRVRPSTYLTKAQQDAWNAHQARLSSTVGASGSGAQPDQRASAAKLFGGVESLIEESQEWFFKDQNQLAVGFENWTDPAQDWASLDLSYFDEISSGNLSNVDSPLYMGIPFSYGNDNMPNDYGQYAMNNLMKPSTNAIGAGVGMNMNRATQAQNTGLDDDFFY